MKDKYVGLNVHQSSTMAAVYDEKGKAVMESILKTEGEAILDFVKGLSGQARQRHMYEYTLQKPASIHQ
jgi:hypothetical protein